MAAIALVGLPGAGKSAVGRRLAQRLQLPFADSDQLIEERIGCSIREFFDHEGEARFRDIEQEIIAQAALQADGVLATGGGVVLREANRLQLRQHFHVVYLCARPEDLVRRLRNDVKRPLLQVADPLARLQELFGQRDPLYRQAAHTVVETGRPSVAQLLQVVLARLEAVGMPLAPPPRA